MTSSKYHSFSKNVPVLKPYSLGNYRELVTQLVQLWAVILEVVSSIPAGPSLRVKVTEEKVLPLQLHHKDYKP